MNPEQDVLYRGVSRIAWSYLFAFFNLNLGSLNILPDWMAFALIYGALDLLAEEERDLPLLKPFCILLGLWEGAGWLDQLFGLTLSLYPLDLLFAALSLYFYFQLLTNLAYLAARYGGEDLSRRLLRLRTAQALLNTFMAVYLYLAGYGSGVTLPGSALSASLTALLIAGVVLMLTVMSALFTLRRFFLPPEEPDPPSP